MLIWAEIVFRLQCVRGVSNGGCNPCRPVSTRVESATLTLRLYLYLYCEAVGQNAYAGHLDIELSFNKARMARNACCCLSHRKYVPVSENRSLVQCAD